MKEAIVTLDNVSFSYHSLKGETLAISNLSFQVNKGEFVAVVGPSGCGKTTILSLIAGLNKPEKGQVVLNKMNPGKIGYMLQQDHLFEWRTILDNVLLGPEITHQLTAQKRELAKSLLMDYGLYSFKNKYPSELSGGMKQRAALIRTMIMEPELLLLDEPFSALDYQTRLMVSADIGSIIRKERITAILITHDLSEAIALADRVLVLTGRPATLKDDIQIHLTLKDHSLLAPRNAPEFHEYFEILWKEIADEYKADVS